MPESVISFNELPHEYQAIIKQAEAQHRIAISPLQGLVGGWSGAMIYLVRVASSDAKSVEHLILKLDRKKSKSASDEITRHKAVLENSPTGFPSAHIPNLAYERVESEEALAIFYDIAGQSLHNYRTLSSYRHQSRIEKLFAETNRILLDEWNAGLHFEQYEHPQQLLKRWLGFRLDAGQNIEKFVQSVCRLSPSVRGMIVRENLYPNPLWYARQPDLWGKVRPGDSIVGLQHSDLNTNNILASFSRHPDELEGYYLIDFALFKEDMPLLYDQRYLEMSYLVNAMSRGASEGVIDLINRYGDHVILDVDQTFIEMAGVNAVIRAGREAFADWVQANHPSLNDDLWGQYWLAGTAAGLSYCHKDRLPDEIRLAGLIFAAANLKQFFRLFGVSLPGEASQIEMERQDGQYSTSGRSPQSSPGRIMHNLPASPTNFIGRAEELAALTALLQEPETGLVSLTGPGGTGKTRLSLEVGRALLNEFPHGVYFIDLAHVHERNQVPVAITHTLGIREGGGEPPMEVLKNYLRDKEMLLILDNFEQVTAAAPELAELLAGASKLKIIVTSRIVLRLRGEHEFPVSPLGTPAGLTQSVEELLNNESIALFRQQAKMARPQFEITDENRDAVAEICRRLDGLPLAIEIAAARIRILSPQAILKRLDQSLTLLVGGPKDLPDRQQALRRTIDWSYELLEPELQALFMQLGVFAGGFTLEAAEAICEPLDLDVFAGIEVLINNSLLRQIGSVSDEPRFGMLQTIREYALQKVEEAANLDDLRWTHCKYFAKLMSSDVGGGSYGADSVMWLRQFDQDHDNYRQTLSWALDHPREGLDLVTAMIPQLTWFWYRFGYLQEGQEWTERMMAVTEGLGDSPPRAMALLGRGLLATWAGDLLVGEACAREAVEMSQRIKFDPTLAFSKLAYGIALINEGNDRTAYHQMVDASELFDQQDLPWMKGTCLVHLANISLGMDDPTQAIKWLDAAMPFLNETGDLWSIAFGLNNYGEVARVQGDYAKAEAYYRRTEELFKLADAAGDQARLFNSLGYIALHKGNFSEAKDLFFKSLRDFRKLGNHRGVSECLASVAVLAVHQGNQGWAVPLLGAAEAHLTSFGGAWWPADRVEIERAKAEMRETLGDERFEELWETGLEMAIEDAINYSEKEVVTGV
jgi:predicted ATPase